MSAAPRPRSRVVGVALTALSPLLLTGCTDSVVAAPTLTGDTAEACQRIVKALPETIMGVSQHDVVDGVQVQWGDPPLVLTCGVEQADDIEAWSACSVMGGVQFHINEKQTQNPDGPVTVHTLGTSPVVRLDVPVDVRPQFQQVVAAVAPVLKQDLTVRNRCQ